MDNPEGALSFSQNDADETVTGLHRFTLLPFPRAHQPSSFALIAFVGSQKVLPLGCTGNREQKTKKPGDKAWGQDVLWTVWCHTWINLFSGRLCMAADALFFVCSDTKEDKWRTAQWIRHLRPSQNKHLMPVSNIGNAAVLNFSCIF